MFEKFTDGSRHVLVLAQQKARLLNHNEIHTGHLLLAMIRENDSVAAQALASLGITLDDVRAQVRKITRPGSQGQSGHIPFTPGTKKALQLSQRVSIQLGHDHIGPEHLLLSMIRESEGSAARVLAMLGVDRNRVRRHVLDLLTRRSGAENGGGGTPPSTAGFPRITYDREVDAAYIQLLLPEAGMVHHTVHVAVHDDLPPIGIDVSVEGRVVGFEILSAGRLLDPRTLAEAHEEHRPE